MVSRIPAHRASAPAELRCGPPSQFRGGIVSASGCVADMPPSETATGDLRRSRAIVDQAEALVEVAIPHRNKLWHRHISRECSGATDEPRDAPSPHWERALSLNEPKASLGKEGEGPAPARRDS